MFLSYQTSVIASNKGLLLFHFVFDCLWSLDKCILKVTKSGLGSLKASKAFESTFWWLEQKFNVKICRFLFKVFVLEFKLHKSPKFLCHVHAIFF